MNSRDELREILFLEPACPRIHQLLTSRWREHSTCRCLEPAWRGSVKLRSALETRYRQGQQHLPARGREVAYPDAEQAQRAIDQFMAGQQMTSAAIDDSGIGSGILESDLAGQGGEIAVAHADLDSFCGKLFLVKLVSDGFGLFPQGGSQHLALGGILQKSSFIADALGFGI